MLIFRSKILGRLITDQHLIVQSSKENTRAMCEICSKLTIKTTKRRHWTDLRRSGVFIVNSEQFYTFFWCFHRWLWTSKCLLGHIQLTLSWMILIWMIFCKILENWVKIYIIFSYFIARYPQQPINFYHVISYETMKSNVLHDIHEISVLISLSKVYFSESLPHQDSLWLWFQTSL